MKRIERLSLSRSVPLLAASGALVLGLSIVGFAATSSGYLQQARDSSYAESLATQIAVSISEPLQRSDLLSVRAFLDRYLRQALAAGISILDIEGNPIAAAGDTSAMQLEGFSAPISIGGDIAGRVIVYLDGQQQRESQWRFIFSLSALVGALSLLAYLGAKAIVRRQVEALEQMRSYLTLDNANDFEQSIHENELTALEATIGSLPLELLKAQAPVPSAASDFNERPLLLVHLASLARYVNTLSETNLHRYSRRMQQIIHAAARCYGGTLSVVRPYAIMVTFDDHATESAVLNAINCGRLIALTAKGLQAHTSLSLDVVMAINLCETPVDEQDDVYPALHLQDSIDELRECCLSAASLPALFIPGRLADNEALRADIDLDQMIQESTSGDFLRLQSLRPDRETLLAHQSELIIKRMRPAEKKE
ncbi:MAG: hypothetical protein AAF756_20410 [Pseudomonadota bacterium]